MNKEESLQHIFFECPSYEHARYQLLRKLRFHNVSPPYELQSILSNSEFYLSNYNPSIVDNDITKFKNYISSISDIRFLKEKWVSMWNNALAWFVSNVLQIPEGAGDESPAIEVFEYRKKHRQHEKKPKTVHLARPEGLWFRVGQVVEHLYEGYKGVIIEWEYDSEKTSGPMYKLLVDERLTEDSEFLGIIEVEQEVLYLLKNTQVSNRFLKNYFTAFDGSQYIPQPWLKQLFPKD